MICESYNLIPILAICGYMNYPTTLRINNQLLFYIAILHNTLLTAFSAYTFISLSQIIYNKGIKLESNFYFQDERFDKLIFYFYISKYYEFFDTFFIYLKGKNPIFLQKYHHIGAVIVWHLFYIYKIDGIWTATWINSFIHSIMYSYYLGSLLRISFIQYIKKYITTLQLCQFLTMYLNFYFYKPPIVSEFEYNIIKIAGVYGTGLIILFGNYYINTYVKNVKQIQ